MIKAKGLVRTAFVAAAGTVAYAKLVRPWVLHWGARAQEVEMMLPGDDLITRASLETTRAISVSAAPAQVWQWIVQMGPRPRAGIYTYDWIERLLGLDIENSDRILPQFQQMEPGEFFPLGSASKGLRIVRVDDGRSLVMRWEPENSTWALCLYEEGGQGTRLVSRNRLQGSGPTFRVMAAIMEPLSLVMERKMLLGIKERAERKAGQSAAFSRSGRLPPT